VTQKQVSISSVAVMQPYFLPYLGYFQLIAAADCFVLFDDVQFIRRGWIERNRYLLEGDARWFGLSLESGPQSQLIIDKRIAADFDCQTLLNKIRNAYRRAPRYAHVMDWLEGLLQPLPAGISELNSRVLRACCERFGINTRFVQASDLAVPSELRGQHRVVELVRRLGGQRYINPAAGVGMYDSALFAQAGVELQSLSAQLFEYPQGAGGHLFVAGLSILDALMFCDDQAIAQWCTQGRLETVPATHFIDRDCV